MEHKINIENFVKNHDFSKHEFNNKNWFKIKELNNIIKKLKNHSAPGKDRIQNDNLELNISSNKEKQSSMQLEMFRYHDDTKKKKPIVQIQKTIGRSV